MNELHVMVDIETLGNDPRTGLIFAIGAVKFDPWHGEQLDRGPLPTETLISSREFYAVLDVDDGCANGYCIETDVYAWWTHADRIHAYAQMRAAKDAMKLSDMLQAFSDWCLMECADVWCWSHGNTFDCMHLMEKFKALPSIKRPLHYRRLVDTRTTSAICKNIMGEETQWPERHCHHHPLDDARVQAIAMQRMLYALRGKKETT